MWWYSWEVFNNNNNNNNNNNKCYLARVISSVISSLFLPNFVLFTCICKHNLWKTKESNSPWDLCWGKQNIQAKKVYSSTSRGVGATSFPGRFSLALEVFWRWGEKSALGTRLEWEEPARTDLFPVISNRRKYFSTLKLYFIDCVCYEFLRFFFLLRHQFRKVWWWCKPTIFD